MYAFTAACGPRIYIYARSVSRCCIANVLDPFPSIRSPVQVLDPVSRPGYQTAVFMHNAPISPRCRYLLVPVTSPSSLPSLRALHILNLPRPPSPNLGQNFRRSSENKVPEFRGQSCGSAAISCDGDPLSDFLYREPARNGECHRDVLEDRREEEDRMGKCGDRTRV